MHVSNAVAVVEHIYATHGAETEILFGPDRFLGAYVQHRTGRRMHLWDGACHVHAAIHAADSNSLRDERFEVEVAEDIARAARVPIERMVAIS